MASYNTLAGLVQFNDQNLADLNVSDLLDDAPLMQVLHAQVASNGTEHKYLKQTTASSSSFRAALDGITKTASADTLVTDTLAILDGSFDTDVALADAYKGGRDAWLQLELMRTMKQLFFNAESQVFYGVATPGDSTGFPGLRDNAQLDALTRWCLTVAELLPAHRRAFTCFVVVLTTFLTSLATTATLSLRTNPRSSRRLDLVLVFSLLCMSLLRATVVSRLAAHAAQPVSATCTPAMQAHS